MRENWRRLGAGEPIEGGHPWPRAAALGAGALLLAFNLALAGLAISGRVARPVLAAVATPPSGEVAVLNANHQRVAIRFSLPMAEEVVVERWSMSWHDEKGRLDYACRWLDAKTLAVDFSREVYPGESIFLILWVADADGWNKERVEIRYPADVK